MRLRPTQPSRPYAGSLGVDIVPGQTLSSFVSCLAARSGLASMQRFCVAFELDNAGIRAGNIDAVKRLSEIAGIPVERLVDAAVQTSGGRVTLMGERLDRNDLEAHPRFCPQCLEDDHADQSQLPYEAAGRYRGAWDHKLVRACSRHDLELTPIPLVSYPLASRGDFVVALRAMVASGRFPSAIHRRASPIEAYIQNRLVRQTPLIPFMDGLPLNDGLFLCAYLGTYQELAVDQPSAISNVDMRLRLINSGLKIIDQGLDAVRGKLEDIASIIVPRGVAEVGLQKTFKQLHERVNSDRGDELLVLRQMLVEIGIERNIIEFEKSEALGLPVSNRSMPVIEFEGKSISVNSRDLRAGLARKKFAKFARHASGYDDPRMIEIDALLRSCLSFEEAARTLGIRPRQLTEACEQGRLTPCFVLPTRDLRPVQYFLRSDLEKVGKDIGRRR